jgi:hypothetical protein
MFVLALFIQIDLASRALALKKIVSKFFKRYFKNIVFYNYSRSYTKITHHTIYMIYRFISLSPPSNYQS